MITLIVVDYQSLKETLTYIQEFRGHASQKISTVIVDNKNDQEVLLEILHSASINSYSVIELSGIKEKVYQCQLDGEEIIIVQAEENLGYARGNNLGARVAREKYHSEYYLFSNNDLVVRNKLDLNLLIKPMERDGSIAVTGPRIIGTAGEQQSPRKKQKLSQILMLQYIDLLLPQKFKFTDKISGIIQSNESRNCYWVSGCFFCAHSDRFWNVGGFDENTFLYYEEMILAERLALNGYTMYYVNDITLIHNHGQTVKSAHNALWGIRQGFESSIYYAVKYRKAGKILIALTKLNFYIFTLFFSIKKYIKKHIKKE